MKKRVFLFLLSSVLATAPLYAGSRVALAAELPETAGDGIRVFRPDYFDEFDPLTALDLVNRTPGFDLEEQEGGRGLSGVRSNILIDGERPPPKGQSIRQLLDEIPVGAVDHVELIETGARLDIDMQGYVQVVNVITVENRPAYYEVMTEYQRSGTGDPLQQNGQRAELEAISTFFWNAHEITFRGDTQEFRNQSPAGFVSIDPANPEQRISSVNEFAREEGSVQLDAMFSLGNQGSLTVSTELSDEAMSSTPVSLTSATDAAVNRFEREEDRQDVSAEYRRPLADAGSLMIAMVDSRATDQSESSFRSNGTSRSSLNERESGETATRIRITNVPADSVTIRTTASTAFNFLAGGFRLFENGVEQDVQGSDNRVEEDRSSVETAVDWNISDRWSLSGAIGAETYQIRSSDLATGSQTDPTGLIAVSFSPRPRTTLTLESRRAIGQLSFGQFLASANLSSEIVSAGASGLDPVSSLTHSARYDRRFGDRGVLRLQLTREVVANPIRQVALSDALIVSRNTGEQQIDNLSASIDYPFERFGMDDLILSLSGRLSQSETVDPITGESRDVSGVNEHFWSVQLRQDPGDGKIAWGVRLSNGRSGDNYSVRSIRKATSSREWRTWLEWEPIDGLKFRTRVEGPRTDYRISRFFDSIRAPGIDPAFVATTIERVDRSASFSVEWRRDDRFEITASLSTRPSSRSLESLQASGEPLGTLLATETATTPRASLQFRYFR